MFKFGAGKDAGKGPGVERKLQLRTERLHELNPAELATVVGGQPGGGVACMCKSDVSNSCCGPNGSC